MVLSFALSEDRTFLFLGMKPIIFASVGKYGEIGNGLCTLSAHPISAYCRIGLLQLSRCHCRFRNIAV